jgi:hypothetical protein
MKINSKFLKINLLQINIYYIKLNNIICQYVF